MSLKKIPLIIDCDPGIDDSFALMLAKTRPELNILGITSVAGNVGIQHTTENMQRLASLLSLDCPLAKGEEKPLVKKENFFAKVHGKDGFGGFSELFSHLPLKKLNDGSAVSLMAKLLEESEEKVSILAVGPLTNLAILVKAYPQLLKKIESFYIMGGGIRYGNVTATAEFNFYADPEAAQVVLQAGVPIVLAPLDITLTAYVQEEDLKAFAEIDNEVAYCMSKILEAYAKGDTAVHDPVPLLAIYKPELFESQEMFMEVSTDEGATLGMSYVDARKKQTHKNVRVLTALSRKVFLQELKEALAFFNKK